MDKQNTQGNNGDTVTPLTQQAEIKQQAGEWIVKVDQRALTEQEKTELTTWLTHSAFHRDYFAKLAKNWDAMAIMEELAAMFPLPEIEPTKTAAATGTSFWSWFTPQAGRPAIAMSVVFCSLLAITLMLFPLSSQTNIATAIGETQQIELTDGSVLTLNTNSEVTVNYQAGVREVSLLRGEAHFEVAKNPDRPFVVYAGDGLVWAVGTAFNVRVSRTDVDVLVTEGRVKVYADVNAQQSLPALIPVVKQTDNTQPPQEAVLDAGQTLQYSQHVSRVQPLAKEQLEKKIAWQRGALVFKGETLEEAVSEISRYTKKQLVIIDPAIKTRRVGGHYQTSDVDALLTTLAQGFSIDVKYLDNDIIHLSAKPAE